MKFDILKIPAKDETTPAKEALPAGDLSVENLDDRGNNVNIPTTSTDEEGQSRRNFLKSLGKAAIVGATLNPTAELFSAKRSKIESLPTPMQKRQFAEKARQIAMRPDMQKYALETKNIPRSLRKMQNILNDIEMKSPGKVDELRNLAQANGIDFSILFAIGVNESNWNPNLTGEHSTDPEAGLMQVKLVTARQVGYKGAKGNPNKLTGLYDPATNLEYAIKYFGFVFEHSKKIIPGDIGDMLGHYNQGPSHDVPSVKYNRGPHNIPKYEARAKNYSDKTMAVFHYYMAKYANSDISDYDLYVDAVNVDIMKSPLLARKRGDDDIFYTIDTRKLKKQKEPLLEDVHLKEIFQRMNTLIGNLRKNETIQTNRRAQLSHKLGIDLAIIYAIIVVESEWESDSMDDRGRIGLMRVTPKIAQETGYNNADLHDPITNIEIGMTRFSKILKEDTDGDFFEALRQYNNQSSGNPELDKELSEEYKQKVSEVLYYYFNRKK